MRLRPVSSDFKGVGVKRLRVLLTIFALMGVSLPLLTFGQVAPRITLGEALQMIDAATKEATAKNYRLSFAVVDSRGDLVAIVRMPGAGPNTPDTAIGKAMASAFFGQPSAALIANATSPVRVALNESTGGRLRYLQGAVPIVRNGVTIGAIGASGANSQQDEDVARAGLAAVMK